MDNPNPGKNKALAALLHDLNQPLTAINNYARAGSALLAAGQVDGERLRELFDKIVEQSVRTVEISREIKGLDTSPAENRD